MDLEALEEKEAESPQPAEAAPRSKKKLFLILGSVMAVLISGLLGAYYGGVFASAGTVDTPEAAEDYPEVNETLALDSLVIQLADKGSKPRFVRLSLTLGIHRPEGESEDFTDPLFQPRLLDRLIFAVGAKTSRDLASPEGREALKAELLQEVSRIFPEEWGEVLELYVTEMLIQ